MERGRGQAADGDDGGTSAGDQGRARQESRQARGPDQDRQGSRVPQHGGHHRRARPRQDDALLHGAAHRRGQEGGRDAVTATVTQGRAPDILPRSEQYGAPELKRLHPVFLRRSILLSSAIALLVVGLVAGLVWIMAHQKKNQNVVVVPYREMQAPPPLSQENQPQVQIAQPTAPPTVGAPIPVPEAEAPQEQTIASQEEISQMIGSGSAGGDSVVIQPSGDELPAFGEFVYVEEMPEAITKVPPEYPEIARASGTEGQVLVQALVGKDGKVKDTRVVKSVPVLDDAAVKAVKQWVFKPALSNNKPVAGWVAVPVRFSLH